MKKMRNYLCTLSIALLTIHMSAAADIDVEKMNRLEQLGDLSLEELSAIKIKLDDVFDIFGGLVKAKKVTVATGAEQVTDRAPSITTVITSQDIEAMGARSLEEVLQSVPGLQVSYTWFNIPVYTIRGISSTGNPEVLVLVNGIRVNNNYMGSKGEYWSGFPISTLSRIEIIRGPGSAVYGADAFSGVINLITKTAQEINGTEVGIRLGNLNTQDSWVLHGSQWNGFQIAAMADFGHTEGHHRTVEKDAQTVWDEIFETHASLAPGPYASDITNYDARIDISKQQWQFRAGVHRGDEMGAGVGVGQALDSNTPMYEKRINADLTYHEPRFTENWDVQAQLSYLQTGFGAAFHIFPPGAFNNAYPIGYIGEPSAVENQTQFALSGFYRGFSDHLIRLGTGYDNYDMYKTREVKNFGMNPFTGEPISPMEPINVEDTLSIFIPEVSRNNKYAFLQDTWTINPNWELTVGLRYDDYSDFGSTTNPRIGLVWIPHPKLTTKLLYGHAFRAPSFSELYNQNNPVVIGDPNLKPEQIETSEIAFDYRIIENLHLSLNLFHYDIKDKIALAPAENSELRYANNVSWKGKGSEFELRWKTSRKSSLLFNYSYQNSKDNNGRTLSNAPKQSAFLRGDYLLGNTWFIDTQINWIDKWNRDINDPRPAMDGYTTVDLVFRQKDIQKGKTNWAIGIHNLFNADVRYPSPGPGAEGAAVNIPNDLPGAGRSFFGEFKYKF